MSHQTNLRENEFIEGTTPQLTYTLKDENGDVITSSLDTQEASIYDAATGKAVGTWTDKDIDGTNGNSVTLGIGTWLLPVDATAKLTTAVTEDHVIAMKFTYNSGRVGKHWILVRIIEQPIGT